MPLMETIAEPLPLVRTPEPEAQGAPQPSVQPFEEYILKVQSRCNLACNYCYMYEMADQSWRGQPQFMDEATIIQTALRVKEHADQYQVERSTIIFHGGEPLLTEQRKPGYLGWSASVFRNIVGADRVRFFTQTNGTLITQDTIDMLRRTGIKAGVSSDGTPAMHDAGRTYRSGKGSYWEVSRGLRLLSKNSMNRRAFGGILCTINTDANPIHTYNTLAQYEPPSMDFLLQLGTWDNPPPARTPGTSDTPYADWLIPVYDFWQQSDYRDIRIRLFDEITRLLRGGTSRVEYLGLAAPCNVVVETNGDIQQIDSLKVVAEGEPDLGLNVRENSFTEALKHPKTAARQAGKAALSQTCQDCSLVEVCGGGYQPHRYSTENGYANPSVYCPDLTKLIRHIGGNLRSRTLAAAYEKLDGRGARQAHVAYQRQLRANYSR